MNRAATVHIVRLKFAPARPYTHGNTVRTGVHRRGNLTMTLLSWRDDYRVGVPLIDMEHQYLIALINEFHDKHANRITRPLATFVLNRLVSYAEEHFQHEETLMLKIGFPRLAHQQKLHEQLYFSIFALQEEMSRENAVADGKTMRFLRHWLLDHILDEDMDIGDFLRRKNAKAAQAEEDEEHRQAEEENAAKAPAKGEIATSGAGRE